MSGISSKAAGTLQNKNLFLNKELQSKEFSDDSGLELYDFSARNYDPQTGHFPNPDALSEKFYQWSPYNYSFNNPIRFSDPTGMAPDGWYKDKYGELEYDTKINSQADLDKAKIKGTFIAQTVSFTSADGSIFNGDAKGNISIKTSEGRTINSTYKDAYLDHAEEAVSVDFWSKQNAGKTKGEIINQRGNASKTSANSQLGGPDLRYVFDPVENKVIDMRHMLIVGSYVEEAQLGIEIIQKIGGLKSAFQPQDIFSNKIGKIFDRNFENSNGLWNLIFPNDPKKYVDRLTNFLKASGHTEDPHIFFK